MTGLGLSMILIGVACKTIYIIAKAKSGEYRKIKCRKIVNSSNPLNSTIGFDVQQCISNYRARYPDQNPLGLRHRRVCIVALSQKSM